MQRRGESGRRLRAASAPRFRCASRPCQLLERGERLERELPLERDDVPPERDDVPPERDDVERELVERDPLDRELLDREELGVAVLRVRVAAPFFAAVLRLAAWRLRVPAAFFAAAERDAFVPPRARSSI